MTVVIRAQYFVYTKALRSRALPHRDVAAQYQSSRSLLGPLPDWTSRYYEKAASSHHFESVHPGKVKNVVARQEQTIDFGATQDGGLSPRYTEHVRCFFRG